MIRAINPAKRFPFRYRARISNVYILIVQPEKGLRVSERFAQSANFLSQVGIPSNSTKAESILTEVKFRVYDNT